MEPIRFGLIVEGHGEVNAAKLLIRRIATEYGFNSTINFEHRRFSRSKLFKVNELEKVVEHLSRQIGRTQPFLVLVDADDDCPKKFALEFLSRSGLKHSDLRLSLVLAKMEYEAWFIAAAGSLSDLGKLEKGIQAPKDPESIRDAKGWLSKNMPADQQYVATRHQAAFSTLMNLEEARQARSFRKLEKEVCRLLGISSTS